MSLTAAKRISVNMVQNMWQYLHQKNANMKTGQDPLTDDFWIFLPECPTLPAEEVQVFSALDVMDTSPLHKLQALFSQAAIVAVASHHTVPQLAQHDAEACVEKPNKSDRDTYTGQSVFLPHFISHTSLPLPQHHLGCMHTHAHLYPQRYYGCQRALQR
jgi:hypothetical protein